MDPRESKSIAKLSTHLLGKVTSTNQQDCLVLSTHLRGNVAAANLLKVFGGGISSLGGDHVRRQGAQID